MPTQTAPASNDLLEAAIQTVVTGYRDAHSGADPDDPAIQQATDVARAAGHSNADIFRTADLRFAQWLIDNSDRH